MTAGPTLHTNRLLLRRWQEDDLEPFAALNGDPVVMEHFPGLMTEAQTEAMIEWMEAHFEEHGYGLWAVAAQFYGRLHRIYRLVGARF